MKFSELPDIEFVSADEQEILSDIIKLYTEITGRTLAQGDPVRLFLCVIAAIILMLCNKINYTGKQNLLRYSAGANLDHLGILVGAERIGAKASVTTIKITLSEVRLVATNIPAGTRATAGDNVFFAIDQDVTVMAGEVDVDVTATCTVAGVLGNGYLPGEINKIVDPIPYVSSMVNITTTEGGSDVESDDSLREAIREAPEGFSVSGPVGEYIKIAKRASALIVDVSVISPEPGKVLITPLLVDGGIPGEEMLDIVKAACNDRSVRPLTDQVQVAAPEVVDYDLTLTYYVDRANEAKSVAIQSAVMKAVEDYIDWQKSKLGRDINPDELIILIKKAGAKRAVISAPIFQVVADNRVAIVKNVSVTFGGLENE